MIPTPLTVRPRRHGGGWPLVTGLLLTWWTGVHAQPPACQDTLVRFLSQLYLNGTYCTCTVEQRERVTEHGRIRRHLQYTLPGLTLGQWGTLPDLSQVQARFWGTIVTGPGGPYALSVRMYAEGQAARAFVRHLSRLHQGQEFEITSGPKQRLQLRTRTPYHVWIESRNPRLRPHQQLVLKGRACFYWGSGS